MPLRLSLDFHATRLTDTVHAIDLAIIDGALMTEGSLANIRMRDVEDKLRMLADRIAEQRVHLLVDQPALPFLMAAE